MPITGFAAPARRAPRSAGVDRSRVDDIVREVYSSLSQTWSIERVECGDRCQEERIRTCGRKVEVSKGQRYVEIEVMSAPGRIAERFARPHDSFGSIGSTGSFIVTSYPLYLATGAPDPSQATWTQQGGTGPGFSPPASHSRVSPARRCPSEAPKAR